MATFIKLTRTYTSGSETKKQPIRVNVDEIVSIRPRNIADEGKTKITRSTLKLAGQYINVAEKFSDVEKKLASAGVKLVD